MTAVYPNNQNGATGFQIDGTVYPQFISGNRAPTTQDIYPSGTRIQDNSVNPPVIYETTGAGLWLVGGSEPATTTTFGVVKLTDNNEPVATKFYADNLVISGAPVATETTSGIGKLVSDTNAVARIASTGLQAYFVQPSNLTAVLAAPGPIGNTTADEGTFTDLTADGTGAVSLGANAASDFTVTGAFDLTLETTAGSIPISAGEAAADAISIQAASGGLDVDTALLLSLRSSRNNASAIEIVASAGGIDISASGASAGEDIDIVATGSSVNINSTENVADSIVISSTNGGIDITAAGASAGEDIDISAVGSSVNISSTENAALSIYLHADGGTSEQIALRADQGTSVDSISLVSDVGGVTITGGLATADAINITATDTAGGIDIDSGTAGVTVDSTGAIVITDTKNAAAAIYLHANGGTSETVKIHADQGTGVASLDLLSDVGGITLTAGLSNADAINFVASGVGGGIDIDSGTAGFIVDTTGAISLDATTQSNFTVTGAADLNLISTAGSININAGEAASDAINIDSTGGFDLDAALQVNITSSQAAAANSVRIFASAADGGMDIDSGTGGMTLDTTGAFSIDGAANSNVTVTGAGIDLLLNSVLGSVLVESTENAALAIRLHADGGTSETIQIHSDQGTGVASVGLLSDVGGLTLRATGLASADAINLEAVAGGIDMDSALQTNIASSQAASTAIQLTASDTAGGITATTGTGNFNVSGGNLKIATTGKGLQIKAGAATDFAGTAILVLGTVTVANTNIATGDLIFLSRVASNGSVTLGVLSYTISNGASFTITSLILGTPASTQTADVSSVAYFIVRPV